MIDPDVELGPGVRIFDPSLVNLFGCSIGENTFIGPFVEITCGVKIGRNCKIESHSFICDGVELADHVFVAHGVMFTNDLYPSTFRQVRRLRTYVGAGASLGSNATIIGGTTLGKFCVVGAGSVVTGNVADFSIVAGNPARALRTFSSEPEIRAYFQARQAAAEPL